MTMIFTDFLRNLPEKSDSIAHNGKQNLLICGILLNLLMFLQRGMCQRAAVIGFAFWLFHSRLLGTKITRGNNNNRPAELVSLIRKPFLKFCKNLPPENLTSVG